MSDFNNPSNMNFPITTPEEIPLYQKDQTIAQTDCVDQQLPDHLLRIVYCRQLTTESVAKKLTAA